MAAEYREHFGEHAFDSEGNYIGGATEGQQAWEEYFNENGELIQPGEGGAPRPKPVPTTTSPKPLTTWCRPETSKTDPALLNEPSSSLLPPTRAAVVVLALNAGTSGADR